MSFFVILGLTQDPRRFRLPTSPAGFEGRSGGRNDNASGFTLIESVVVMAIVSMVSVLALNAIPVLRAHQELVADTENFRSLLFDSKQRTVNQVRPPSCLSQYEINNPLRAACSDVGIAIYLGELIQYANTANQNQHTYEPGIAGDFEIAKIKIVSTVEMPRSLKSLLFISMPPTVVTYSDGAIISPGNNASSKIYLNASDGSTRVIIIHSLGTIDIE